MIHFWKRLTWGSRCLIKMPQVLSSLPTYCITPHTSTIAYLVGNRGVTTTPPSVTFVFSTSSRWWIHHLGAEDKQFCGPAPRPHNHQQIHPFPHKTNITSVLVCIFRLLLPHRVKLRFASLDHGLLTCWRLVIHQLAGCFINSQLSRPIRVIPLYSPLFIVFMYDAVYSC